MKKVHEHRFKRAGMTLYCSCGAAQNIKCAHKWDTPKIDTIVIEKLGGEREQSREMRFCKVCGAVLHTNRTTGVSSIIG